MFPSLIVDGLEFQESRVHYTLTGIKSLLKIGEGGPWRERGGSGTPGTLPWLRPCNMIEQYLLTRSSKSPGQMVSNLLLRKISDQTISNSSLIGLSTRHNKIDQSQNKQKKMDIKYSDDLLGNMQLKLSFYGWCISILSSKKCQTPIILADLLGNESLLQRVIVCDL